MRPSLALLAVFLLAPLMTPGSALAQPQDAQPLDRLLPEIRRNVPGQFLDAEGINRNGAPGYRLKWLTPDGRVITRDVDARTGRSMGAESRGYDREPAARPQPPRGNFFPGNGGDDDAARFERDPFPRDFRQQRQDRPGPADGESRFRNERFGGNAPGERGRFGNGRARGRGD